jgi:hypothetical protein
MNKIFLTRYFVYIFFSLFLYYTDDILFCIYYSRSLSLAPLLSRLAKQHAHVVFVLVSHMISARKLFSSSLLGVFVFLFSSVLLLVRVCRVVGRETMILWIFNEM